MEITKAEFVKGSSFESQCPKPDKSEFAFIGRSNVGKSSLINMLVNKTGLAKVSSTPGKTIAINHFLINDSWYLVDLPGYGYAKRSKDLRKQWIDVMDEYFCKRENLACVFTLIDSRIKPQAKDIEFLNYLGEKGVAIAIVFTKLDKNRQHESAINMKNFKNELLKYWEELPPIFATSAVKKTGRKELLEFIHDVIKSDK